MNQISPGIRFRRPLGLFAVVTLGMVLGSIGAVSPAAAAPAEHEAASCAACHGAASAGIEVGNADIERACLVCHEMELRRGDLAMHAEARGGCLACHEFHSDDGAAPVTADARFASHETNPASDHCAGCHADGGSLSNLSPGHRVAAALYHRDRGTLRALTPSEACLLCHGETPSAAWIQGLDAEPIALNRHASHPFGVVLSPGARTEGMPVRGTTDPRIPLFSGRMECTSCHLISAGEADLLRPFSAKYDLCLGCHMRGGDEYDDRASLPVAWAGAGR